MANNVDLITWQNMDVTPVDDALVYETAIGAGGIIYGCEATIKNSNTLHINAGHAIICGRKMTVVEDDIAITLATAGVQKGRLYMQLDLSNTSTPAQLITEVSGALTPPIQDDNVNITNGTFEINLYIFDVSPTEISNLVRVANPLANILGNFAKIETRMVATKDYEIGDFMVKDNQLLKALARINSGDMFSIGGNVKKTTVGEEITDLTSNFSAKITKAVSSGTMDIGSCHKFGKVVSVFGRIYNCNEPASGVFFTIPDGFRPKTVIYCAGYAFINGVATPCITYINTNGDVYISYSPGITTTQVYFSSAYGV